MVRRVVTGEKNGKSVFLSDGPVDNTHNYAQVPGFQTTLAWATLRGVAPLPHAVSEADDRQSSAVLAADIEHQPAVRH